MSSHGKVADLLDERYLNLQDVYGNVAPFPTLVPYEQYVQSIIVYRLNTNHEFYVPLLQDFTDRFARSTASVAREAWTWFVQWDVEQPSTPPAAKKQRRDNPLDVAPKNTPAQPKKPYYGHIEPRLLHQELYLEENILRILVDIVQVDSKLVPNYVEFLYQWIDYYEGSGRALKAALRQEIPSLWLFEFHPLPLFNANEDAGGDGLDKAAEKMGEKLTKPKKPLALAEMERLTEQSERLQYREVRFGIHRPIVGEDPLPPLINIPYEDKKRLHYYAACFNNRQRALFLLQEAGMTLKQIANYKKLQPMSPLETPEDINGHGFLNYYREEPSAHVVFTHREHLRKVRERQREVAISNRLAEEERLAAHAVQGNLTSKPTIAQLGLAGSKYSEVRATHKAEIESKVPKQQNPGLRYIPEPMLGLCKSTAFARAIVKPQQQEKDNSDEENTEIDTDDSSDDEEYSDPDDIDPDEREEADTISHGLATHRPLSSTPSAQPIQLATGGDSHIARFVQSFNATQLTHLLPRLNPQAQEAVRVARPDLTALHRAPQLLDSNPNPGLNPYVDRLRQGPNTHAQLQMHSGAHQHSNLGYRGPIMSAPSVSQVSSAAVQSPLSSGSSLATTSTSHVWPSTYSTHSSSNTTYTSGNAPPSGAHSLFPHLSNMNGSAPASHSFQNSPALRNISAGNTPIRMNPYAQVGYNVQGQPSSGLPVRYSPAPAPGGMPPIRMPQGSTQYSSSTFSPELHARLQERANAPSIGRLQSQVAGLSDVVRPPGSSHEHVDHATPGEANQVPRISLTQNSEVPNAYQRAPEQSVAHRRRAIPQAPDDPVPSSTLPLRDAGLAHALHIPNEYTSAARMPAALSFAEILQTTNRAPPPPNLDLHGVPFNHPSHLANNVNQGSPIAITPLLQKAGALSLASPIQFRDNPVLSASPHGVPIQIYLPKVVIPHNGTFHTATDCLILGYTKPETGILELSKAIFLPTGIWENILRRVQRGHAQVLETYAPPPNHPRFVVNKGILRNPDDIKGPHKFVHTKLTQIFALMTSCSNREQELTKRWRITPGPMTAKARGAVWEGWGLFVDRPVELSYEERHGVGSIVSRSMDGKRGFGLSESEWKEKERRTRELDEMLEEDEEDSDEDLMQQ